MTSLEHIARIATPALLAHHLSKGRWQRARHLMALDREICRAVAGFGPRIIIIQSPPRHGKSEYVSKYLPVWYATTHPHNQIILASYEASFARSWGQKARNLIKEHSEQLGIHIDPLKSAAANWGLNKREGGMSTAGVGGPLTGKGANLLIVDDSIKNAEEALSPTVRDNQWDWWQSTVSTRMEPGGLAIVMMTRWHEEDLPGRLLAAAADGTGHDVTLISMPALAEEDDWLGREPGEALWPERWPVSELEKRRRALDSYWWQSLYQQAPARHGSTEWPGEYWGDHLWIREMPKVFDRGAIGVDPSKGSHAGRGDYSAIQFVGLRNGLIYVDGTVRRRPVEQIVTDGIDHALRYADSLYAFAVETNQFQELLVGEFEKQMTEHGLMPLPIYTIDNRVNKKMRISRLGPYFARRRVRILDTPDNRRLVEQLKQFSMKDIRGVHDDGPDALEMAIRTLTEVCGDSLNDQPRQLDDISSSLLTDT